MSAMLLPPIVFSPMVKLNIPQGEKQEAENVFRNCYMMWCLLAIYIIV